MKSLLTRTIAILIASVLSLSDSARGAPLVQDGSFESNSSPGTLCAGTNFGAWVVERGSIDVTFDDGLHWTAAAGNVSIDLSGSEPCSLDGAIYQDLPTAPGGNYRIRFALAGNIFGLPLTKTLKIHWGGTFVSDVYASTVGRSGPDMGWRYYHFIMPASNTTTRLSFSAGAGATGYGPAIDDISVDPAPCGGTLDLGFDAGIGIWPRSGGPGHYSTYTSRMVCSNLTYGVMEAANTVTAMAVQPDNKVLIAGGFESVRGIARTGVARLNIDGTVDPGLAPSLTLNNGGRASVESLVLRSDGRILIGGIFDAIDGEPRRCLAQLNTDGSLDRSFVPQSITLGWVYALAVTAQGRIVASVNHVEEGQTDAVWDVVRLLPKGELDTSFELSLPVYTCPGTGTNELLTGTSITFTSSLSGPITSLVEQPDGRLLLDALIRLEVDGSHDPTYAPDLPEGFEVSAVRAQPDGKILVAGGIPPTGTCDEPVWTGPSVIRINPDGSRDPAFFPPTIPFSSFRWCGTVDHGPRTIVLQADGRILLGGMFTMVNGIPRTHVARLHANGLFDPTFESVIPVEIGADEEEAETVSALALAPDGKLYIGGLISRINGHFRPSLVRVHTGFDGRPYRIDSGSVMQSQAGRVRMQLEVPAHSEFTVQASVDLVQWTSLSNFSVGMIAGPIPFEDVQAAPLSQRFYRIAGGICEP